ncbi:unnamed protein product [Ixodes hexagonus]
MFSCSRQLSTKSWICCCPCRRVLTRFSFFLRKSMLSWPYNRQWTGCGQLSKRLKNPSPFYMVNMTQFLLMSRLSKIARELEAEVTAVRSTVKEQAVAIHLLQADLNQSDQQYRLPNMKIQFHSE